MCSLIGTAMLLNDEDDDPTSIETPNTVSTDSSVCKKCRVAESKLTLRKKDSYCVECFLAASKHKFRATLGKHKIMSLGEDVLVYYKGSLKIKQEA